MENEKDEDQHANGCSQTCGCGSWNDSIHRRGHASGEGGRILGKPTIDIIEGNSEENF